MPPGVAQTIDVSLIQNVASPDVMPSLTARVKDADDTKLDPDRVNVVKTDV